MLNRDNADAIAEPKTGRVGQRPKPHVDARHQETAVLFSVELERARIANTDHEHTVLSVEDRDVLLAALDAPAQPTDALRQAMSHRGARVVHYD